MSTIFCRKNDLTLKDIKLFYSLLRNKLTYLSKEKLAIIASSLKYLEANKVEGQFIEAGCALGGSTILIAKNKNINRVFNIYDVFGMIPPPSHLDGEDVHERYEIIKGGKSKGLGKNRYYGYENDLMNTVVNNLVKYNIHIEHENIHLIKGLIQDTMQLQDPVAFAHIDVDWYESVKTCLKRIAPLLSINGIIVIDDYNEWSGCKKAVDEYFSGQLLNKYNIVNLKSSLKIQKIKE